MRRETGLVMNGMKTLTLSHGMRAWIAGPPFCGAPEMTATRSFRRHAQRPVQADRLAVEVPVLDDMACERRVFLRLAERLGEWHRRRKALLHFIGQTQQHRREKDARRDCADANAELRKLAR